MRRILKHTSLIAALAVVSAATLWYFSKRPADTPQLPQADPTADPTQAQNLEEPTKAKSHLPSHLIEQALPAPGSKLTLAQLDSIAQALDQLPPHQAAETIAAFLDTHIDRPTGLRFTVGENGSIPTPTSLRVFLLDKLSENAPSQAAAYSYTIFESKESPDEWALALRNLGRIHPQDTKTKQEVARYADELLKYPPWQSNPTPAYLEAFDAIAFAAQDDSLPELCAIINDSQDKALRFAAYLTLERLVEQTPTVTLDTLSQNPSWLDKRPQTRAGLFAKLNQASPQSRPIVATYLSDERFPESERIQFLNQLPNSNQFHSYTLLSKIPNIGYSADETLAALGTLLSSIDTSGLSTGLREQVATTAQRLNPTLASAP